MMKFYNFLLFNSLYVDVSLSCRDSGAWRSHLRSAFLSFHVDSRWLSVNYSSYGRYFVPESLIQYLSNMIISIDGMTSLYKRNLREILSLFLELVRPGLTSYEEDRRSGRLHDLVASRYGVTVAAIPFGRPLTTNLVGQMLFNCRSVIHVKRSLVEVRDPNFLGLVRSVLRSNEVIPYDWNEILQAINYIRDFNCIRLLLSQTRVPLCDTSSWQGVTQSFSGEEIVLVNLGLACVLCVLDSSQKCFTFSRIVTALQPGRAFEFRVGKPADCVYVNKMNGSTPKLSSVLHQSCYLIEWLLGTYSPLNDVEYRKLFSSVLLLGTVGDRDPISIALHTLFDSRIVMVGAHATGRSFRALSEEFEFSQGFSCVISDMDQASDMSESEYISFLMTTLIAYIDAIQPSLLIWKVNYCCESLRKLVIHVLSMKCVTIRSYFVSFVYPEFSHVVNYEGFVVMYKVDVPFDLPYIRLRGDVTDVIVRDPYVFSLHQSAIRNYDDLISLSSMCAFTRGYVLAEVSGACFRPAISAILHDCKYVYTNKLVGGDTVLCSGVVSYDRVFLTRRFPLIRELKKEHIDELALSTLQPGVDVNHFQHSVRGLGDFTREVSRYVSLDYRYLI